MPCQNCGHRKDTHLEDGTCLFEPTVFSPVSFGLEQMGVLTYVAEEPVKPSRPYPEPTKYDRRKERILQMKAQRRR